MQTAWSGRRVIGMSDCLWGLLDGVNDDGLAVSLTFGGRTASGEGFAIPLVVRYRARDLHVGQGGVRRPRSRARPCQPERDARRPGR